MFYTFIVDLLIILLNGCYFRLINNDATRSKWNDFLVENKMDINKINKNSLICSAHFEPRCFVQYKNTKLLNRDAIPTMIITRISSVSIH